MVGIDFQCYANKKCRHEFLHFSHLAQQVSTTSLRHLPCHGVSPNHPPCHLLRCKQDVQSVLSHTTDSHAHASVRSRMVFHQICRAFNSIHAFGSASHTKNGPTILALSASRDPALHEPSPCFAFNGRRRRERKGLPASKNQCQSISHM